MLQGMDKANLQLQFDKRHAYQSICVWTLDEPAFISCFDKRRNAIIGTCVVRAVMFVAQEWVLQRMFTG